MIFIELFISFFKIGMFSFGGGYAILALIQKEVVNLNHWVTTSEYFDIVAISQMTPGPIAINAATYIGYKVAGFWGAVIATLGVILPAMILMFLITISYVKLRKQAWFSKTFEHLKPVALAMMLTAIFAAGKDAIRDWQTVAIFCIALIIVFKTKINPFVLLLGSGIIGAVLLTH